MTKGCRNATQYCEVYVKSIYILIHARVKVNKSAKGKYFQCKMLMANYAR